MNTITLSASHRFVRGDRLALEDGARRIVRASAHTLTARRIHRFRAIELVHSAWERAVAWPFADAIAWVRARL